ncbi:hypothetical protein RNJ44_04204 [Nakaseomyces bracarensis]|uniref:Rab-GAP TBC domain-containing protein n=1 Tax=Nakaseomyces bracarensis TaxID=273131 RepID=A0ABR4NU90_9SACH
MDLNKSLEDLNKSGEEFTKEADENPIEENKDNQLEAKEEDGDISMDIESQHAETTEIENELKTENANIKKAIEAFSSPPLPPRDNIATEDVKIPSPPLPPRNESNISETGEQSTIVSANETSVDEPPLPPRNVEEQKNVVYHTDFIMYTNKRLKSILNTRGAEVEEKAFTELGELKELYIEEFEKLGEGQTEDDRVILAFVRDFPEVSLHDLNKIEKLLIKDDLKFREYLWPMLAFTNLTNNSLVQETNSAVTGLLDKCNITGEEKKRKYSTILTTYLSCDPKIEMEEDLLILLDTIYSVIDDDTRAYTVFKSLMSTHGLRELYINESEKDKLVYYYFDRYLEDNNAELFNHLAREGVLTYRYLSDWLRTLFQRQLSEETNAKIIDLILLEGLEGILRIPLAILVGNELTLLKDRFDELYDFVQNKVEIGEYSTEFIVEAMDSIKLTPRMILTYKNEYEEIHRLEREREEQYEYVKTKNLKLQEKVKKLEHDYTFLNREHVTIANELIVNQLNIEEMSQKNHKLRVEMMNLRKELEEQIKKNEIENGVSVPKEMKKELDNILIKNSTVMSQNVKLQDKVAELERVADEIKKANMEGIAYEEPKAQSWGGLKKISTKFQASPTP